MELPVLYKGAFDVGAVLGARSYKAGIFDCKNAPDVLQLNLGIFEGIIGIPSNNWDALATMDAAVRKRGDVIDFLKRGSYLKTDGKTSVTNDPDNLDDWNAKMDAMHQFAFNLESTKDDRVKNDLWTKNFGIFCTLHYLSAAKGKKSSLVQQEVVKLKNNAFEDAKKKLLDSPQETCNAFLEWFPGIGDFVVPPAFVEESAQPGAAAPPAQQKIAILPIQQGAVGDVYDLNGITSTGPPPFVTSTQADIRIPNFMEENLKSFWPPLSPQQQRADSIVTWPKLQNAETCKGLDFIRFARDFFSKYNIRDNKHQQISESLINAREQIKDNANKKRYVWAYMLMKGMAYLTGYVLVAVGDSLSSDSLPAFDGLPLRVTLQGHKGKGIQAMSNDIKIATAKSVIRQMLVELMENDKKWPNGYFNYDQKKVDEFLEKFGTGIVKNGDSLSIDEAATKALCNIAKNIDAESRAFLDGGSSTDPAYFKIGCIMGEDVKKTVVTLFMNRANSGNGVHMSCVIQNGVDKAPAQPTAHGIFEATENASITTFVVFFTSDATEGGSLLGHDLGAELPEEGPELTDQTPGNAAPGNAAPGNAAPGNAAPGNAAPGNAAPGNAAPETQTPGNAAPGNTAPGNTAPGNPDFVYFKNCWGADVCLVNSNQMVNFDPAADRNQFQETLIAWQMRERRKLINIGAGKCMCYFRSLATAILHLPQTLPEHAPYPWASITNVETLTRALRNQIGLHYLANMGNELHNPIGLRIFTDDSVQFNNAEFDTIHMDTAECLKTGFLIWNEDTRSASFFAPKAGPPFNMRNILYLRKSGNHFDVYVEGNTRATTDGQTVPGSFLEQVARLVDAKLKKNYSKRQFMNFLHRLDVLVCQFLLVNANKTAGKADWKKLHEVGFSPEIDKSVLAPNISTLLDKIVAKARVVAKLDFAGAGDDLPSILFIEAMDVLEFYRVDGTDLTAAVELLVDTFIAEIPEQSLEGTEEASVIEESEELNKTDAESARIAQAPNLQAMYPALDALFGPFARACNSAAGKSGEDNFKKLGDAAARALSDFQFAALQKDDDESRRKYNTAADAVRDFCGPFTGVKVADFRFQQTSVVQNITAGLQSALQNMASKLTPAALGSSSALPLSDSASSTQNAPSRPESTGMFIFGSSTSPSDSPLSNSTSFDTYIKNMGNFGPSRDWKLDDMNKFDAKTAHDTLIALAKGVLDAWALHFRSIDSICYIAASDKGGRCVGIFLQANNDKAGTSEKNGTVCAYTFNKGAIPMFNITDSPKDICYLQTQVEQCTRNYIENKYHSGVVIRCDAKRGNTLQERPQLPAFTFQSRNAPFYWLAKLMLEDKKLASVLLSAKLSKDNKFENEVGNLFSGNPDAVSLQPETLRQISEAIDTLNADVLGNPLTFCDAVEKFSRALLRNTITMQERTTKGKKRSEVTNEKYFKSDSQRLSGQGFIFQLALFFADMFLMQTMSISVCTYHLLKHGPGTPIMDSRYAIAKLDTLAPKLEGKFESNENVVKTYLTKVCESKIAPDYGCTCERDVSHCIEQTDVIHAPSYLILDIDENSRHAEFSAVCEIPWSPSEHYFIHAIVFATKKGKEWAHFAGFPLHNTDKKLQTENIPLDLNKWGNCSAKLLQVHCLYQVEGPEGELILKSDLLVTGRALVAAQQIAALIYKKYNKDYRVVDENQVKIPDEAPLRQQKMRNFGNLAHLYNYALLANCDFCNWAPGTDKGFATMALTVDTARTQNGTPNMYSIVANSKISVTSPEDVPWPISGSPWYSTKDMIDSARGRWQDGPVCNNMENGVCVLVPGFGTKGDEKEINAMFQVWSRLWCVEQWAKRADIEFERANLTENDQPEHKIVRYLPSVITVYNLAQTTSGADNQRNMGNAREALGCIRDNYNELKIGKSNFVSFVVALYEKIKESVLEANEKTILLKSLEELRCLIEFGLLEYKSDSTLVDAKQIELNKLQTAGAELEFEVPASAKDKIAEKLFAESSGSYKMCYYVPPVISIRCSANGFTKLNDIPFNLDMESALSKYFGEVIPDSPLLIFLKSGKHVLRNITYTGTDGKFQITTLRQGYDGGKGHVYVAGKPHPTFESVLEYMEHAVKIQELIYEFVWSPNLVSDIGCRVNKRPRTLESVMSGFKRALIAPAMLLMGSIGFLPESESSPESFGMQVFLEYVARRQFGCELQVCRSAMIFLLKLFKTHTNFTCEKDRDSLSPISNSRIKNAYHGDTSAVDIYTSFRPSATEEFRLSDAVFSNGAIQRLRGMCEKAEFNKIDYFSIKASSAKVQGKMCPTSIEFETQVEENGQFLYIFIGAPTKMQIYADQDTICSISIVMKCEQEGLPQVQTEGGSSKTNRAEPQPPNGDAVLALIKDGPLVNVYMTVKN